MPAFREPIARTRGISGANAALTVSSPPVTKNRRTSLSAVYIAYSANVAVTVTVTINSGVAPAYDTRLASIDFVANRYGWFVPERAFPLADGDVIDVVAPAGGAGITAAVQILLEHEYPPEDRGAGGYPVEYGRRA